MRAVYPQRAVVRIDVARFAIIFCAGLPRPSAGEEQVLMARFAIGQRMTALQRKTGVVMFEFDIQAQWRPAFGGVAIAASVFDFPVRIVLRGDLGESGNRSKPKKKSARKAAEPQRSREGFLCDIFPRSASIVIMNGASPSSRRRAKVFDSLQRASQR